MLINDDELLKINNHFKLGKIHMPLTYDVPT